MVSLQNGCFPISFAYGGLVKYKDMLIHSECISMRYGLSLFEGVRGYVPLNGERAVLFKLDEHVERLIKSCSEVGAESADATYIKKRCIELLNANDIKEDCYLRIAINFTDLLDLSAELDGALFLSIRPMGRKKWLNDDRLISLYISDIQKPSDEVFPQKIKNISNYPGPKIALTHAKKMGFDSVLLKTKDGKISEAPTANIFICKDGELITPPVSDCILPGITRQTVIELANEAGIAVQKKSISEYDLQNCDEAFLCGTGIEFAPIGRIGGTNICASGEVTKKLISMYFELVRKIGGD